MNNYKQLVKILKSKEKAIPIKYYKGKIFSKDAPTSPLYRIKYRLNELKEFFQRGLNGYSHSDVWSIRDWFSDTFPHILSDMLQDLHSGPPNMEFEEWENELSKMLYYFMEANDKTCSQTNEYEKEYILNGKSKLADLWWKRSVEIETYKNDCLKKGLDLFNKYFNDLWD